MIDISVLCASTEWFDAVRQWIVPWAVEGVDLGDDVLEIGPGPGATTEVLHALAPRLTAVELDDVLAARLTERYRENAAVEVVRADATATGLPGGRFDSVVCLTMLHHVPGRGRAERAVRRGVAAAASRGRVPGQRQPRRARVP